MSLFREEVLRGKSESLYGTITIALPMSWGVISLALSAILVAAGIFIGSASYSRTEQASGNVIPEGGILQILPTRPGRVETVAVTEGQMVRKGAVLAVIGVEEINASGQGAQASTRDALQQQDRSLALQMGWTDTASHSEQRELSSQLAGMARELTQLDSQIDIQREFVRLAESELKRTSEVAARGFVSQRDLAAREEAVLARRQQLAVLEQARAAKLGSIRQAEHARSEAAARSSATAAGLASNRAQVQGALSGAGAQQGYQLVAPADGQVTALKLHIGDAVTPQDITMMIVPAHGALIAQLYVPGKAAGAVRPGQQVRLALDAYPYARFGTVPATIAAVSSAPVFRPESGSGAVPYYVATVAIPNPYVHAYGRREALLPGMTLSARIFTEKRSILQWLFDPLYAAGR